MLLCHIKMHTFAFMYTNMHTYASMSYLTEKLCKIVKVNFAIKVYYVY